MAAPAGPFAATLLPDADFRALKAEIVARTGHHYYLDKDDLLWERVRRRLQATGLAGAGAYLARLRDLALGEAEWAALEAEVTIGETFFFRYAEQFAALGETILPALLEQARPEGRLRIWSAGCASGAEPYSVAILLGQLLGEALPDWRLSILGTDLNEAVLRAARQARFSRWALRTLSPEALQRDFIPSADGRHWLLRSRHRAMVRFERHNLLSLLDGSSPLQFTDYDLILCRNVLIYFHPDMVLRIVEALAERLREGGWLLLGHAEPNPEFARFLEVVNLPGTVAYRRRGAAPFAEPAPGPMEAVAPPPPWPPGPAAPLPPTVAPPPPAPRPAPPVPAPAEAREAAGKPAPDWLERARAAADRGDLLVARQACEAGLAERPLDAALHYYEGLVQRGLGQRAAAGQAFRRALYLRGDFAMAHYQLGLLLLDEGEAAAGRRTLAVASRIAHALPPDREVEEGDGMTARALRETVRLYLGGLSATGAG
ncbi:protein-glutamate methyltransferase [Pseudoroseomonas rhizosphaerae]|uniref:protein-glutamate O-methyltransferase n=1 Tax=Teichococcus rhizosphaerae TaxID=1335062 RepID=A0A2C6Y3A2_9PROT|nr:protein-glutamate O-methyltransferase CheR [Pseudoroseomonas rhizosphaerae]PHK95282.1 protein-glutamate methyltransferase [Pseudoroseomonas rhizosphaerae]